MYKIKKNFCLGLSKPLNIFDYKMRKMINLSIKNDLYFHISISYPLNFYFVKYLLSKKKRLGIKFISKILGDSMLNFRKSFKLTLNELGIKKLYIAQLVNLPILDPKKRRFDIDSIIVSLFVDYVGTVRDVFHRSVSQDAVMEGFDSLPWQYGAKRSLMDQHQCRSSGVSSVESFAQQGNICSHSMVLKEMVTFSL